MQRLTRSAAGLVLILASAFAPAAGVAETIKLGVSKLASCSPIAIALAKGYFTEEGLTPQLVFFDAQQPIAVAAVSGDVEFGIAAETAALYTLAGDGKLRVIGGGASEAPSFHYLSILASNHAFETGLKSVRDLPDHTVALTQMGTGLQYAMGQIAVKYGFDVKRINFVALQSNANIASALAGGRVDASIFSSTGALPLLERGDVKLLGWAGDETPVTQAYLLFTSADMATKQPATVEKYLHVYRKAARLYHDAFTDHDGKRKDQATAPEILDILAAYLGQPVALVKMGLPYFDGEGRIDAKDLQRQIDWYRSQGLIKTVVSADAIIDKRFAKPMPQY
ncbi:MAG TPA: ABC transporter substrate-binding protein [Stellaceae bacterium]|nr:ABC transporter substrate-binding protein [Stellaceae bacterium]